MISTWHACSWNVSLSHWLTLYSLPIAIKLSFCSKCGEADFVFWQTNVSFEKVVRQVHKWGKKNFLCYSYYYKRALGVRDAINFWWNSFSASCQVREVCRCLSSSIVGNRSCEYMSDDSRGNKVGRWSIEMTSSGYGFEVSTGTVGLSNVVLIEYNGTGLLGFVVSHETSQMTDKLRGPFTISRVRKGGIFLVK